MRQEKFGLHFERNLGLWTIGAFCLEHDLVLYRALWFGCFCLHWQER
ncbi:MAG: hypothetical protein MUC48_05060 [Leptolyngbya sp. Prado105]|jgi:hypothetical protein|nr:hypothetical protein [Leptolyngbya sp. Prado105]